MRRRSRSIVLVGLAVAAAFASAYVSAACGSDEPLQGDEFMPNGSLPTEPASARLDGGACDGDAACEASAGDGAAVLPVADGAAPPSNTCQTARAIGTMSGDTGGGTLTASGKCSEWISLRATEDDSSVFGVPMKVSLTLKSMGHDFDLYVYFSPSTDVSSCGSPYAQSETRGTVDEVIPLTWGESSVGNGSDDGRTINVAIQSAEGPCPAGAGWSLTADGNR